MAPHAAHGAVSVVHSAPCHVLHSLRRIGCCTLSRAALACAQCSRHVLPVLRNMCWQCSASHAAMRHVLQCVTCTALTCAQYCAFAAPPACCVPAPPRRVLPRQRVLRCPTGRWTCAAPHRPRAALCPFNVLCAPPAAHCPACPAGVTCVHHQRAPPACHVCTTSMLC